MARVVACPLLAPVLLLVLGLTGCGGEPRSQPTEWSPTATGVDEELRRELLRMARQDQGERTSGATLNDAERTERLEEIVAQHGWPTYDLVGRDGEDAAWVIAQHSDLDPEFQAKALELLRAAVEEGQASPGNLAYLEDRVRAARGEPQLYGTQVGCTRRGPEPGPIEDRAGLDERRAEAGLPPFDRYLRTMERICRA